MTKTRQILVTHFLDLEFDVEKINQSINHTNSKWQSLDSENQTTEFEINTSSTASCHLPSSSTEYTGAWVDMRLNDKRHFQETRDWGTPPELVTIRKGYPGKWGKCHALEGRDAEGLLLSRFLEQSHPLLCFSHILTAPNSSPNLSSKLQAGMFSIFFLKIVFIYEWGPRDYLTLL